MKKHYASYFLALASLVVANFLLWIFLRDTGYESLSDDRVTIYKYFVMYVFYFSFLVAGCCVASAVIRAGLGDGKIARMLSLLLFIPSAVLLLSAGLLSLAIAFNGKVSVVAAAVMYSLSLWFYLWAEFKVRVQKSV